ncbi:MAG: orotate phosphoribosyltransferase [Xanthobacteraceae bacterium]
MRRETDEESRRAELLELIRQRSFGRGKIKLASGRESDFYFDLRPTTLHPAGATHIGDMIIEALEGIAVDYVGGLAMGAIPIATAASMAGHRRGRKIGAFFVRKKAKEHGERKLVEGLPKGETLCGKNVVIVEDVTTTGGSALQAVDAVQAEGAIVVLVLTIVDRLEGASDNFATQRLPFRSLFTADEFLTA